MGRRTVILIAAFVIAALGAGLIFLYVDGLQNQAEAEAAPVEVLTATATVDAGESVSEAAEAGKFALTEVPGSSVLDGALTSTETLSDQVALAPLYPGEQVVSAKFGEVGSESRITIPDKAMAVSVELTDPQRVAGFVSPGSEVAIFSTVAPNCGEPADGEQFYTRLLLPKVPVVGVGQTGISATTTTESAKGAETVEQVPVTILTVGLDQKESEQVILAKETSCLSLGLLTEKSVVKASSGTAFDGLFGRG